MGVLFPGVKPKPAPLFYTTGSLEVLSNEDIG